MGDVMMQYEQGGMKRHHAFMKYYVCLQVLESSAQKVGLHRGEPYYLREQLTEVHSANMWLRQGRTVRSDEVRKPLKRVKNRQAAKGRQFPDTPIFKVRPLISFQCMTRSKERPEGWTGAAA